MHKLTHCQYANPCHKQVTVFHGETRFFIRKVSKIYLPCFNHLLCLKARLLLSSSRKRTPKYGFLVGLRQQSLKPDFYSFKCALEERCRGLETTCTLLNSFLRNLFHVQIASAAVESFKSHIDQFQDWETVFLLNSLWNLPLLMNSEQTCGSKLVVSSVA